MSVNLNDLNSLTLAYLGDAVYELYIREYLIESGNGKPNKLHDKAIQYVSAEAQASIIHFLLDSHILTDQEERIMKRGRNAKSVSVPKNISVQNYRYSTGFEALIGYLYIQKDKERLQELIQLSIEFINN